MFSTKTSEDMSQSVHKEMPSARGTQMLTGIHKIKMPPSTEEDLDIIKRTSLQRCNTGKPDTIQRTPMSTARSTGRSTGRRSGQSTSRSTGRREQEADVDVLKKEKEHLEDQLWDVSHKADWLKAQTGLRTTIMRKDASPDRWLNNGAKMYMANRYKTTSMTDYVGYHGEDVFADQVTDTSNRKIRGQAAKYGNRLSSAKITLRGNF
tara:strand:+ start:16 stop:636 length:621 start_codon:yes stop_codon:yes gene_type:complete